MLTLNAYTVYQVSDSRKLYILTIVLLAFACALSFRSRREHALKKSFMKAWLIYICFAMTFVVLPWNHNLNAIWVIIFCYSICAFWIYSFRNAAYLGKMLKSFVIIGSLIALISLLFWVFGSLLHVINPTNLYTLRWGRIRQIHSYYNLYFEAQYSNSSFIPLPISVRNCNIFPEASAAAYYYSIILLLNVFWVKYKPKVINSILVATIFSTMSTIGWIVIVAVFECIIISIKPRRFINKALKWILVAVTFVFGLFLLYLLITAKLTTISGISRSQKFTDEFALIKRNIFFGKGFGQTTIGSSNSFTSIWSDGGIVLLFPFYYPVLRFIVKSCKAKSVLSLFGFMYLFLEIFTVYQYALFSVFINVLLLRISNKTSHLTDNNNNLLK